MEDQLPVGKFSMLELYTAIRELPRKQTSECKDCKSEFYYPSLSIYSKCPQCGKKYKVRSFGAYSERQDIIQIVMIWLGLDEGYFPDDDSEPDWFEWDDYFDYKPNNPDDTSNDIV